jgi:hypothetical protein
VVLPAPPISRDLGQPVDSKNLLEADLINLQCCRRCCLPRRSVAKAGARRPGWSLQMSNAPHHAFAETTACQARAWPGPL